MRITHDIFVDEGELNESFVRSSGPGGQNVNKVATAVQLRFDVHNSPSLPAAVRARLKQIASSNLTTEGVLIISASKYRSQVRNRNDARERLASFIRQAAAKPKVRHRTKPSRGSVKRRLESKQQRGETKKSRQDSKRILP